MMMESAWRMQALLRWRWNLELPPGPLLGWLLSPFGFFLLFAFFLVFPCSVFFSFLSCFPMKVITWNCQGAASKNFLRAAKMLLKKHHPDIFCLMETKTSGDNADTVCCKLGFENWARVEALGFSGGIWVFWSDALQVEILTSQPQFVHMAIRNLLVGGGTYQWSMVAPPVTSVDALECVK